MIAKPDPDLPNDPKASYYMYLDTVGTGKVNIHALASTKQFAGLSPEDFAVKIFDKYGFFGVDELDDLV